MPIVQRHGDDRSGPGNNLPRFTGDGTPRFQQRELANTYDIFAAESGEVLMNQDTESSVAATRDGPTCYADCLPINVIPKGVPRLEESGFTLHTDQTACAGVTQIPQSASLPRDDIKDLCPSLVGSASYLVGAIPMPRLLLLAAYLMLASLTASAAELSLTQEEDGITVNIDGEVFTRYLKKSERRPVLWPLIGPTGKPMTRAYPVAQSTVEEAQDHPHHRSVWIGSRG